MKTVRQIILLLAFSLWTAGVFFGGYLLGAQQTFEAFQKELGRQLGILSQEQEAPIPAPASQTRTPAPEKAAASQKPKYYTGPELWEAVNKARVEYGVNALKQKDILCTIAAIRLGQIRELGKLDGHDGFKPVFEKYKDSPEMPNNVSEFLISGYPTPDQAVLGWLDTLGHKKLITGGEYVWGCIYAQDGFGVAITGY